MMKDDYLYSKNVVPPPIPQDVIDQRLMLLRNHLELLLNHSWHMRDSERCNDVLKAIEFWEDINGGR